jgi:hypothetical protein
MEKRAAKQARRKVDAASATTRTQRPAATLELKPAVRKSKTAAKRQPKKIKPQRAAKAPAHKPRAQKPPDTMRSAAEVAKSVIERLHAPPPVLPPAPIIPAAPPVSPAGSTGAEPGKPLSA